MARSPTTTSNGLHGWAVWEVGADEDVDDCASTSAIARTAFIIVANVFGLIVNAYK